MNASSLSRRDLLRQAGVTAAAAGMLSGRAAAQARPNIILIMADDLGYECLSCNGATSYQTPRLDEMARTGARFRQCYAQPLCTPSRVQIMTGQYNFRNYTGFGVLKPGEKTFGHVLQQAGYATCVAGKWQLWGAANSRGFGGKGVWPEEAGFDEYCLWQIDKKGGRYADPMMHVNTREPRVCENGYGPDIACAYLLDFVERKRRQPFFAYYPMILTHNPFVPTPHSAEWKSGNRLEEHPRFFKDEVEYADTLVGRILDKLDELELREHTLVLFLGDNGTNTQITTQTVNGPVRGHKGHPDDGGTRVPFVVNCPGIVKSGRVLDDLVDLTDFLPTFMEAGSAAPLEGMIQDGRSFLPRLRGEPGNPREWIFCHYDPDWSNFKKARFARDQRWKLYDDGRLFDIPADVLEQHPIMAGDGGPAATAARNKLQPVLNTLR